MKRESLVRKIPWEGGRSISGGLSVPRTGPTIIQGFFSVAPHFSDERHSNEIPMLAASGRKAAAVSDT